MSPAKLNDTGSGRSENIQLDIIIWGLGSQQRGGRTYHALFCGLGLDVGARATGLPLHDGLP